MFEHFCIVLTFDLTENLNTCFLLNFFLINLNATVFFICCLQWLMLYLTKLKLIVQWTEWPVSTISFIPSLHLKLISFCKLFEVIWWCLDTTVLHVCLIKLNRARNIFKVVRRLLIIWFDLSMGLALICEFLFQFFYLVRNRFKSLVYYKLTAHTSLTFQTNILIWLIRTHFRFNLNWFY